MTQDIEIMTYIIMTMSKRNKIESLNKLIVTAKSFGTGQESSFILSLE